MTKLNPGQAAAYLKAAGFPQTIIPTFVAIGWAESDLDTEAIGSDGHDFGWLQTRDVHRGMAPDGYFPPGDGWKDPLANAILAKKIYDGQGLGAWAPSDNAKRKSYAGQAQMGAAQVAQLSDKNNLLAYAGYKSTLTGAVAQWVLNLGGGLQPGTSGGLSPDFQANGGQGYPDSPGKSLVDFFNNNPERLLWIGGGSILVILGVLLLAKSEALGSVGKALGK